MVNAGQGFKNILVAMDFSPSAEAAFKQAEWLARRTGAQIALANVIPDLSMSPHWGPEERESNQRTLYKRSEAAMHKMVADLNATDLNIEFKILIGEPFVEITLSVQTDGFDLVLAGTQGLAMWKQAFIGSTAKRLIRTCPASVFIVKAGHVAPPKVVLAATDFSDVSLKAVKEGLWIAQQSGAEFHLLHIIDSKDVPEDMVSNIPEGSSMRQEIDAEASRRLDEFLGTLTDDRTQIQVHLSLGRPWQEIQRMSQHLSADLVVIGTVGRSGIKGMLLGNSAEKILDTSGSSTLAVKPAGFVSPIEPPSGPLHSSPESHES
ncbi:MAG TPA: universal stress protein [Planctomycetaceae bacterium]|nr:universal stress protein [Planctomycetaceae bacterium]